MTEILEAKNASQGPPIKSIVFRMMDTGTAVVKGSRAQAINIVVQVSSLETHNF